MIDPYFWSAQPLTGRRLRGLAAKVRSQGVGWLMRRVLKELRQPETEQGVRLRRVNTALFGSVLQLLTLLPAAVFRLVAVRPRTLMMFYDLKIASITFDIVDYLMLAELERRRLGLDAVHVVIVPRRTGDLRPEDPEYDAVVDRLARMWRLHNLVIPMFALFPNCNGYTLCSSRIHGTLIRLLFARKVHPPTYWPAFPVLPVRRLVFDAGRRGEKVFPGIKPPEQAMRFVRTWLDARLAGRRPVVITLRQYGHAASRNSNVAAWIEFARGLDQSRFAPVFVQDVDTAMAATPPELEEFLVFREAPFNIHLRAALYELAWLNVCQTHGPTELMWYNEHCRYVIFITLGSSPQTELDLLRGYGIEPYVSAPFATPYQKWVWEPDRVDIIEREFAEMKAKIEAAEGHAAHGAARP